MSKQTEKNIIAAHRIAVAYQRRLIDALGLIGDPIVAAGYRYIETQPIGVSPHPSKSKWLSGANAWSFQPLHSAYFQWWKGAENTPGFSCVFVEHTVDTVALQRMISGSAEVNPESLGDSGQSSVAWWVRWFHMDKKAKPVAREVWDNAWNTLVARLFDNDDIWSYDLLNREERFASKDGIEAGSFSRLFDEICSPEQFKASLVEPLLKHLRPGQ